MNRFLPLILLLVLLAGCRTSRVVTPAGFPVEVHERHDTVIREVERETIRETVREVRDSSATTQRGDTVTIEHWHFETDRTYELQLLARIDSLAKVIDNLVPEPVEVVREVERPLKPWQKALIAFGGLSVLLWAFIVFRKL